MRVFLSLLIAPGLAWAECPPAPDVGADVDGILAELRVAPNEAEARSKFASLWELWAKAPDEAAQALLDRGMQARATYNFIEALDALDRLVEYCPNYAEGYNQRAFVNFLRQDFEPALVDLDEALARRPNHVAAMSGKALTLIGLGRTGEAELVLREALRLNPWLPERNLLPEFQGDKL